jgi:hypothetical protein
LPVLANFVPLGRAAVEHVDELEQHEARWLRGKKFDGVVVDFLVALDRGDP